MINKNYILFIAINGFDRGRSGDHSNAWDNDNQLDFSRGHDWHWRLKDLDLHGSALFWII
jgi:hypothetical protein